MQDNEQCKEQAVQFGRNIIKGGANPRETGRPQCRGNNTTSVLVMAKKAHGRQNTEHCTAP